MHYRDGTQAQLGDIARGRGYNLPYPVQGVVVGLAPGHGSCDIHVLTAVPHSPLGTETLRGVTLLEEHGTCAEWDLVHRNASPSQSGR